ncbi:hypothetical protein [Actinacidiphila glaucinigra]|uniref:hypothetical protein n=1 Tax=Actinacidiphila glaucinigra TaxID=235986 RepID=UPI00366F571C
MLNTTRIAALALLAAVGLPLTACASTEGSRQQAPKHPDATVSASKEPSADKSVDAGDQEDDTTITVALDGTATWRNGVKAKLSGFSRGVSGPYAAQENTAYLRFKVTVVNGSKKPVDLSMITLSCPGGGEEIFDSENGLSGVPSNHVLAGESGSWTTACSFAKSEKRVQIEVTPFDEDGSSWYRTAIFRGTAK